MSNRTHTLTVVGVGIVLIALLILGMAWSLFLGTVHIPAQTLWQVVASKFVNTIVIDDPRQGALNDIVWMLRMPRVILAALVGAGLAVSGVIMQAIVKNPLADPYILGISSGASTGATVAILMGVGIAFGEEYVGIMAFIGAMVISFGVLIIANMGGRANAIKLLLAGMALSAVCSAFTSIIVYFAKDKEGIQNVAFWMMGSLAGANWDLIGIMVFVILVPIVFFWFQTRILNLMLLGDEVAITLGIDLHRYRQLYLVMSSIMIGFAVYAAGIIGFVGLLIPHIVRQALGTNHKGLIPISALGGALLLVVADTLSRTLIPHTELPIGILISVIGAPAFVYLMIKQTYAFGGN